MLTANLQQTVHAYIDEQSPNVSTTRQVVKQDETEHIFPTFNSASTGTYKHEAQRAQVIKL